MQFVPLHIYSGYSFLKSGLTMARIFESAATHKYSALGLTDLDGLFGYGAFFTEAKKAKIKGLPGLDLIFEGVLLTFYAIDETGYRSLIKLSYAKSTNTLNEHLFESHRDHLLLIISTNNPVLRELRHDEPTLVKRLLKISRFAKETYIGIEYVDMNDTEINQYFRAFAQHYVYPVIAFPFFRYQKPEDHLVIEIVDAIRNDQRLTEKKADGFQYFLDESTLTLLYSETELLQTVVFAEKIHFSFSQTRGELLKFPWTGDLDAKAFLRKQCEEGYQKRQLDADNPNYLDRVNYELNVIDAMGYNDYFLIVQDLVNYAKSIDIFVGPGRGSAAGSLVSYLLGITEIDPLPYRLLFERFLNPSRQSLPDIDIDFADIRRDEIVTYLRHRYGPEHVANIITFQTLGAKASLRDIGRIYEYSPRDIDLLAKTIGTNDYSLRDCYRFIPAFRQLVNSDPYYLEIVTLAAKIEGLPRQSGLHAAGIILNNQPLVDALPILDDGNQHIVSQYEMDFLENQGFLKMDILGLTNLTTIEKCLDLVKKNHKITLLFNDIPYQDPQAINLIRQGLTMGLFQLESTGMKLAIEQLQPSEFEDVVALLALFRPGPKDYIPAYALRKQKKEKTTFIHPSLEGILSPTYGIIIYQEQIMQIATTLAGFSLAEADLFRRAISKKDATKLKKLEADFIAGSIKNGVKDSIARDIFAMIDKFALYGFNRSHSVAYARLACQMAYLKLNYPAEFYAAILDTGVSTSDSKFADYMSEIKAQKVKIYPPNVNLSGRHFSNYHDGLLFPLTAIKGIPGVIVDAIIHENTITPFMDFGDFVVRLFPYKLTLLQLTRLIEAGAFDHFNVPRSTLLGSSPAYLRYASMFEKDGMLLTIDRSSSPYPAWVELDMDPMVILEKEREALGYLLSDNPLNYKEDLILSQQLSRISDVTKPYVMYQVVGMIKSFKTIKTKKGQPMAFMTLYDDQKELETVLFPEVYAQYLSLLNKHAIVVVEGQLDEKKGQNLLVRSMRTLEEIR